ncbi:MAG: hypothetical protein NC483_04460 [Ruminococcus sp.]|nr:hypothetical protein [Ruminococcus sp.]
MFNNKNIKPMLLGEVDKPFNSDSYLYELKFDGYRVIMYVSKEEFVIKSRNNHDITYLYPELKSIQELVGKKEVIFDGEIVSLNNGYPSFKKLQERSHLKNKDKIREQSVNFPVTFVAFDILYENKSLIDKELILRKKILDKYKENDVFIKSVVYNDGVKLFDKVKKLGLEGIIAKEKKSFYISGKRVNYWLKIKNFKKESFYIHGFIFNKEKYSLLLGEYRNNKLMFVGKISVSPKNNLIKELKKIRKVNNFFSNYDEEAIYIEPIKKVLVSYMERTDNNMLREPFLFKA